MHLPYLRFWARRAAQQLHQAATHSSLIPLYILQDPESSGGNAWIKQLRVLRAFRLFRLFGKMGQVHLALSLSRSLSLYHSLSVTR